MAELVPIIVLILLFLGIMLVFSKEKLDYVGFSLLAAVIGVAITVYYVEDVGFDTLGAIYPNSFRLWAFITMIDFEPIIFLICMQMIVTICEKQNIYQWVALKVLYFTKGDHRKFFYLICTISAVSAAFIADITVAVIFIPLVIRACKILKINATTYLFGISFTVNIGSLYTPFSSSENILISQIFDLNMGWFMGKFTLYVVPVLFLTLFALDMLFLRKITPPTEERKKILLDIMDPNLVIINRKAFIFNSVAFIIIIIALIIAPSPWPVAAIGAILLVILNRLQFTEVAMKIDWKVIFFFISLFLLIGCMEVVGLFDTLKIWAGALFSSNDLVTAIIVLYLIGVLSGFLAQVPTALIMIKLLASVYPEGVPFIILMGFLFGINLGSNFLPQGAAVDLMALNLAEKNGIKDFNYNTLLKRGSTVTVFHLLISTVYLSVWYLFTEIIF